MDSKGYTRTLFLYLVSVFLCMLLTAYLIVIPGFHGASALAGLASLTIIWSLSKHINKTNIELARFFDAIKYRDFSQRFDYRDLGSGLTELGDAFSDVVKRLQLDREGKETQVRHLRALVEHVPVPLLSVHADGRLTLWNNSARRFLGDVSVARIDDLTHFGEGFYQGLCALKAGERRLARFEDEHLHRTVTLQATEVIFAGRSEKLISIQDIQTELDSAQLQAWQDLVRVLTHEIMNSITPVTSLARTAVDLLEDVKQQTDSQVLTEELEDVTDAVNTVARRSDGLMNFVTSYRRLTRLPPAKRQHVSIQTLLEQAIKVARPGFDAVDPEIRLEVSPSSLKAELDTDMVEQLLINVLLNAAQALTNKADGRIHITAYLNKRGHVVIDIGDNGPGIPDDIGEQVFVPFFTTKREGSGVGLALTRQVMQAHGGSVRLDKSPLGGALFSLVF